MADAYDEVFDQHCRSTPEFVDIPSILAEAGSTNNKDLNSAECLANSNRFPSSSISPSTIFPNAPALDWLQPSSQDQIPSPTSTLSTPPIPTTATQIPTHSFKSSYPSTFSDRYECGPCCTTMAQRKQQRMERRREQNRASQRRFRASKEAKIKEGEDHIRTLEQQINHLVQRCQDLEQETERLRAREELLDPDSGFESLPGESVTETALFMPLFNHELVLPGL